MRQDHPVQVLKTADDLRGWTIGYLKGANLSPFLRTNAALYTLDALAPEDYARINLQKLVAGHLDAIFDLNDVTYLYVAKQMGLRDRVRLLRTPDPPGEVFVVASKKSARGREFLAEYSKLMKKGGLRYEDFLAPYLE